MCKTHKRNALRLVILDILREENLHGYKIAERLSEKYGVERISSGFLYPILQELQNAGLIEISELGSREKKIYRITEKGMEYLKSSAEELEDAKIFLKNFGTFQKMGGEEFLETLKEIISVLDKLSEDDKKVIERTIKTFSIKISKIVRKVKE